MTLTFGIDGQVLVECQPHVDWLAWCPTCTDPAGVEDWIAGRRSDEPSSDLGVLLLGRDVRGVVRRPLTTMAPVGRRHGSGLPWYAAATSRRWSTRSRWWDPWAEPEAPRSGLKYHDAPLPCVITCYICEADVVIEQPGPGVDIRDYTA